MTLKRFLKKLVSIPLSVSVLIIRGYQIFVSPFFAHRGSNCRFHPACSEYFLQAIRRFGIFKGGLLGVWRILRCHPFGRGGWDPVPEN